MKHLRAFHTLAVLGIASSVALVSGLFILTRHMDYQQRDRESKLVSSQVDSGFSAAKTSALAAAKSDEAIRRLDHARDAVWAAETFHSPEGTQIWIYTLDAQDRIISSPHASGMRGSLFPFEVDLPESIQSLRRDAFQPSTPHAATGVGGAVAGGFWKGDELYLLVAAPFVPASPSVRLTQPAPPVVAVVTPMKLYLNESLAGVGVDDMRLSLAGTAEGGPSKTITDPQGRAVAQLRWKPGQPGAELLRTLIGPLLVLVSVFLTLVAYAYRQGIVASRQLVESEARAHHLAMHDYLTELANRRQFMEELDRAVARAKRIKAQMAVLLIDLDRFKSINDTYGHQSGDELICEAARRLTSACRSGDLCARLGGDEFVILAHDCGADAAGALAQRVLEALSRPAQLSGALVQTAGSVGISLYRGQADGSDLMREADLALYRVKENGRNAFRFFEVEMDQAIRSRRILETSLLAASVTLLHG